MRSGGTDALLPSRQLTRASTPTDGPGAALGEDCYPRENRDVPSWRLYRRRIAFAVVAAGVIESMRRFVAMQWRSSTCWPGPRRGRHFRQLLRAVVVAVDVGGDLLSGLVEGFELGA